LYAAPSHLACIISGYRQQSPHHRDGKTHMHVPSYQHISTTQSVPDVNLTRPWCRAGNTLAFSKLPLRDLLLTLKDIMGNFLALANDLFKYACQLNADQKYTWHKNLQVGCMIIKISTMRWTSSVPRFCRAYSWVEVIGGDGGA
jgi:hypothetical protein